MVIGTTEYLGVCFLDGTECTFDTPALGNAQPLYPDTIDYAPLENNAEFLIYERANVVGEAGVLGRTVPYKVKPQRKSGALMYQIAYIGRWETLPETAAAIYDHNTSKLEALL